jgi:hypothetical protein
MLATKYTRRKMKISILLSIQTFILKLFYYILELFLSQRAIERQCAMPVHKNNFVISLDVCLHNNITVCKTVTYKIITLHTHDRCEKKMLPSIDE